MNIIIITIIISVIVIVLIITVVVVSNKNTCLLSKLATQFQNGQLIVSSTQFLKLIKNQTFWKNVHTVVANRESKTRSAEHVSRLANNRRKPHVTFWYP